MTELVEEKKGSNEEEDAQAGVEELSVSALVAAGAQVGEEEGGQPKSGDDKDTGTD